jgi:hypothetical protein
MNRLITLFYEKNHYLEKFYSCGEKELENFIRGEFGNLDAFYETRERILEMIRYVDAQIEKLFERTTLNDLERKELKKSLTIKDEYVQRIMEQDLSILACIDQMKSSLITELQNLRKGKTVVSKYKMPSFIKNLDEEA